MKRILRRIAIVMVSAIVFFGIDYTVATATENENIISVETIELPGNTDEPGDEQSGSAEDSQTNSSPENPENTHEPSSSSTDKADASSPTTPSVETGNTTATSSGETGNTTATSSGETGNTNTTTPSVETGNTTISSGETGNTTTPSVEMGNTTATSSGKTGNTTISSGETEISTDQLERTVNSGDSDSSLRLKSLSVQDAELIPTFSPDTYEYQVNVDETITEILIRATAYDSASVVIGTGAKTVTQGLNTFEVRCRNSSGDEQTYVLKIIVGDVLVDTIEIEGKEYQIAEEFSAELIPTDFEAAQVQLDDITVNGIYSEIFEVYGIAVMSENQNIKFYAVDDGIIVNEICVLQLAQQFFLVRPVSVDLKLREGYEWKEVSVDGQTIYGWVHKEDGYDNLVQLYLRAESGEEGIFQYDIQEDSVIKYSDDIGSLKIKIAQTDVKNSFFFSYYTWIFIAVVIVLGAGIIIILNRKA